MIKTLSEEINAMIKTIFEEKEAKARTEMSQNMLLIFLRARFDQIPKDIENAILVTNDPSVLDSLAACAGRSHSLADFADVLKIIHNPF